MTMSARLINNADGSPNLIEIEQYDGGTRVQIRQHWLAVRSFSGQLLELIREAEANSDPA